MSLCTHDVLILGGGPAGAAAAMTLARGGASVAVIERSSGEEWRSGEMLPAAGCEWLRRLGVLEIFLAGQHVPSPGVIAVWESDQPRTQDFILQPHGCGWVLDRQEFDAMLAAAAEQAGADWHAKSTVTVLRRCEHRLWEATIRKSGDLLTLRSQHLVDATGRGAWAARRLGVERFATDQLVAVLGQCAVPIADQRLLLEAIPTGWWYSIRLPSGRVLAACLTDADLLPRGALAVRQHWRRQLVEAPWTRAAWGVAGPVPLRTISASSSRLLEFTGRDWLAVGDAAFSRDPLSSSGIVSALESGIRGGTALLESLEGRRQPFADYRDWMETEYRRYLSLQQLYYTMVQRWPESEFWQRRWPG